MRGFAAATSAPATGVFGVSASTAGVGVAATANATSGTTFGLVATAKSSQGTGLLVQNTAGGPLIRAKTDHTLFTLDGNGNLATAGNISSAASLSATTINISGGGMIGGALSASTVNTPNVVAATQATVGSNPSVNGQGVLIPDNLDIVHSYIGQAGQQMHFRLSRSSPDPDGAQHFLIAPYNWGMAIQYPRARVLGAGLLGSHEPPDSVALCIGALLGWRRKRYWWPVRNRIRQ